ncbi:hypothetical protein BLNAU_8534 [Blattamonas nauphoetae]|uniref:N-acetyltransferase domain-containing protein n=1 Tax=Blattamonas nauphoetae TaxID=2049346 RepID=A0ABQ9XY95_9EUKA|nr:hypothetical protein BLNAU_8534 [Blattamonas nauphoetae]
MGEGAAIKTIPSIQGRRQIEDESVCIQNQICLYTYPQFDHIDVRSHQCRITHSDNKLVRSSLICPHSEEDAWVLDRIAVMEEFRRKRFGVHVVRVAINDAQLLPANPFVRVNAQDSAIPFHQANRLKHNKF